MNVLWIMCDQLRHDYLGCSGHPSIKTPAIDQLAARGVRFSHAYAQSTICGPSRMSAYTGRYVRSHGSSTNESPLRVGEPTLGDHLRKSGFQAILIGKTHMKADREGMARLGISEQSTIGVRAAECGFDPFLRDDGLHSAQSEGAAPAYFEYLRTHGYEADNPWEEWAASAIDDEGTVVSGWFMRHAGKPSRIPAELSETAFVTDKAIEFLNGSSKSDRPWCLHVSYIKPHWPYIAPAPYHKMYNKSDILPVQRSDLEQGSIHPVYKCFQEERYSKAFSRDEVQETVIPCYMGLISHVDDEIGRLLEHLSAIELDRETLIIFSSDHGDYLGGHWLGEKQLFHDQSVRVPLIVSDPPPDC